MFEVGRIVVEGRQQGTDSLSNQRPGVPEEEGAEAVRPGASRRVHALNGSVDFIMRDGAI
jgi:hypothetical protein